MLGYTAKRKSVYNCGLKDCHISLGCCLSTDASPTSPLAAWAQLVRLPNVFTVLADVGAAFLLVAHGPQPAGRFVVVLLAGVALYWGGMILNDVFDVQQDIEERPSRPIPAGHIGLGSAQMGWLGFAAGRRRAVGRERLSAGGRLSDHLVACRGGSRLGDHDRRV